MKALPSGTDRNQRAFTAVVLAAFAVAALAVAPVGLAGAQTTGATPVNSCTTIDSAGQYVLTENVTSDISNDDTACIEITAGNVTLDGAGHSVTGSGSGHGVEVDGTAEPGDERHRRAPPRERVDGRGVRARRRRQHGRERRRLTGPSPGSRSPSRAAIGSSTSPPTTTRIGVAVGGESNNNTVRNALTVENKWGIHFERESGNNAVRNSIARNNSNWDYYSMRNRGPNEVSNLELSTATLSFTEQNVAFRAITDPPALPAGTANRNAYVQIFAAAGQSTVSMTMGDGSGSGSATLWRATDDSWSRVPGATSDSGSVSAENLTEFGVFAALSDSGSGGTTNVTTQPVAVGPARDDHRSGGIERRHHERRDRGRTNATAVGSNTTAVSGGDAGGSTVSAGGTKSGASRATAATANGSGAAGETAAGETSDAGGLLSSSLGLAKVLFALAALVALVLLGAILVIRRRRGRNRGF